MSTIDTRREAMVPKLEPGEIGRLGRFGKVRRSGAGEALFVTGEIAPGMFVLIKGSARLTRRDPLGHSAPIADQGPGEFVAEVGQLSGQPAFVDVHAIDDVEALLIPPENLRALMIEEPELGERIMRALILRRIALVEAGASGRIENYLGFPAGISGQALTARAYVQAQKFGARMVIPTEVVRLDLTETPAALHLDDGRRLKASTVVVATGARYRRLNVPNLQEFEGRGVWYWASPIEARLCRSEEIVL